MRAIHISDQDGRDSPVVYESKAAERDVQFSLADGSRAISVKFIKSTQRSCYQTLYKRADGDLSEVARMIIDGDPEVDSDYIGKITAGTKTVYLLDDGTISYMVRFKEIIYDPRGVEISRADLVPQPANISAEMPLIWTGRFVAIDTAVKSFIFSKVYQIRHMNGLTYDFLYGIAKLLEQKRSFLLLGAGEKGKEPLRFSRGALPYRGFLRGRVRGEDYCLSLHLTNLELKEVEVVE